MEWIDVTEPLKSAVEKCEALLESTPAGTRRYHEYCLARHNMLDAMRLLASGRVTPDDLVWGQDVAQNIIKEGLSELTEIAQKTDTLK